MRTRKKFEQQFKRNAVKRILEEGCTVKEVSQMLNVHPNSLYRWVREYKAYGAHAFLGHGITLAKAHYKRKELAAQKRYFQEELELLRQFQYFSRQKE